MNVKKSKKLNILQKDLSQVEKYERTYNYYYSKYSIEVLEQEVELYKYLEVDMSHRIPRITLLVLIDKRRDYKLTQLGIEKTEDSND